MNARYHVPPVFVDADPDPIPTLDYFRRCPAVDIAVGDLVIRDSAVWRVKAKRESSTSARFIFTLFPMAGGRPETDVYFPRQWLFVYRVRQGR